MCCINTSDQSRRVYLTLKTILVYITVLSPSHFLLSLSSTPMISSTKNFPQSDSTTRNWTIPVTNSCGGFKRCWSTTDKWLVGASPWKERSCGGYMCGTMHPPGANIPGWRRLFGWWWAIQSVASSGVVGWELPMPTVWRRIVRYRAIASGDGSSGSESRLIVSSA